MKYSRKQNFDLLRLAFNIEPDSIAPYSNDIARNKVKGIFLLSADELGVKTVLSFQHSVKMYSGISLKIHALRPHCIDADFAVSSKGELKYLSHFCDEPIFLNLAAEHRLVTFDFKSDPTLPTFVFE